MTDKKWSELQIECYNRNCNCRNCKYNKYNQDYKCQVKWSILKDIKKNGLKEGLETKKWL